jgi:hypothetical protein
VKDGGYHREELWSHDGWRHRTYWNAKWPSFWSPDGPQGLHKYKLRTIFELVDLPYNWPAIVNYYES